MSSAEETRTRQVVRERSAGICELQVEDVCLGLATNISHRKAVSQGGQWTPSNCLHACGSGTTGCHGWVEAHPAHARGLGLRLRRGDAPAATPAFAYAHTYGEKRWLLLHDGGEITDVTFEETH